MDSESQVIAILVLLVVFVLNATQPILRRRGAVPLRPLAVFERLPEIANASIETGRPVHLGLGSAALGTESTVLALAGSEFAYYTAQHLAYGDVSPIYSVADTSTLPLALDTLRRAYLSRDRLASYRPVNVRWYPAGPRSLAHAGGLMALQSEEEVAGNVLAGSYGIELALILSAASRRQRPAVAATDQLAGQAVAYAMADTYLIGEEIFSAPAYLGSDRASEDRTTASDSLRWLVGLALLAVFITTIVQGG